LASKLTNGPCAKDGTEEQRRATRRSNKASRRAPTINGHGQEPISGRWFFRRYGYPLDWINLEGSFMLKWILGSDDKVKMAACPHIRTQNSFPPLF